MMKDTPHGKNIKLAGFFIFGVASVIFLSFLWKTTILIAQSKFDSKHEFNLIINNNISKIVCFSPETRTLYILNLNKIISKEEVTKDLEIPTDAILTTKKDSNIQGILFNSVRSINDSEGINTIDKIKLWWYVQTLRNENIYSENVTLPISDEVSTNIIQKFFNDKTIYGEAKTIQVINATGITGLGGRLARLLTNIGGNVITVDTSQNVQRASEIVYSKNVSYTDRRIEKILGLKSKLSTKQLNIADIIITIGSDMSNTSLF